MEMTRESRIALDPPLHAPHPSAVRDETEDPTHRRAAQATASKTASAPMVDREAKLAAALRANLTRRKALSRARSSSSAEAEKGET
jgi:hypothetical protein